jgi:hypothetical protein
VGSNIQQAHSQLKGALNRPGKKTDFGMVAVSLSRTFTKGNLMLHGPVEAGRSAIRAALAKMLRDNANKWGLHRKYHERVVALMFYLAVQWDIDGVRLIHLHIGLPRHQQEIKRLVEPRANFSLLASMQLRLSASTISWRSGCSAIFATRASACPRTSPLAGLTTFACRSFVLRP